MKFTWKQTKIEINDEQTYSEADTRPINKVRPTGAAYADCQYLARVFDDSDGFQLAEPPDVRANMKSKQ